MQFREFVEFQKHVEPDRTKEIRVITPTELLEESYQDLRAALTVELLDKIKSGSPASFERLVLDLLEEMGYGHPEHVGRTGDGGIDGTIFEDDLGLDVIHIQAKKWDEGTVGRKEVQAFAGSLEGQRARKGVFITTSHFSQDARDYVKGIEKRIVLIDGEQLASLMIDNDIGVKLENSYEVKKVDADYFSQP
jgi:restriction system protein